MNEYKHPVLLLRVLDDSDREKQTSTRFLSRLPLLSLSLSLSLFLSLVRSFVRSHARSLSPIHTATTSLKCRLPADHSKIVENTRDFSGARVHSHRWQTHRSTQTHTFNTKTSDTLFYSCVLNWLPNKTKSTVSLWGPLLWSPAGSLVIIVIAL